MALNYLINQQLEEDIQSSDLSMKKKTILMNKLVENGSVDLDLSIIHIGKRYEEVEFYFFV